MQIIIKRNVQFNKYKYGKDKEGNLTHSLIETINVTRSSRPQLVPDWVRDDPHYKLLKKDKLVIEVVQTIVDGEESGEAEKKAEDIQPTDLEIQEPEETSTDSQNQEPVGFEAGAGKDKATGWTKKQ